MSEFKPWMMRHIELNHPVPELLASSSLGGYFVVFWWHGMPVGQQQIPAIDLPMTRSRLMAMALAAISSAADSQRRNRYRPLTSPVTKTSASLAQRLEHALQELEQHRSPSQAYASHSVVSSLGRSTSIVVCTRDRPAQLERCLQSLQSQSLRPYEILVVDNAPSSDATRQLVSGKPGIRYVLEPRPGLSAARNAGFHHSTGEIIASTDDDITAHPDWLARLLRGFHHPQVMAVTGLTLPSDMETDAQWIFETDWSFVRGYRPRVFDQQYFAQTRRFGTPVWHLGGGGNMAVRRCAFARVGGFDERLGAGAAGCSEDSEFFYRLLAAGWACQYEPAAVVFHHHRSDIIQLRRQIYFYMRGHVTALLIQFARYRHWGNLARLLVALPSFFGRSFVQGVWRGVDIRCRIKVWGMLGCFAGIMFFLRHRHAAPCSAYKPRPIAVDHTTHSHETVPDMGVENQP